MARKSSVISVLITGDAGPLKKALGGVGSKFASFGKVAIGSLVAVGAATAAMAGKLIAAGERAATANARIEQITKQMGLFGDEADKVAGRLVKVGEGLARATGVDTNVVKQAQGILLTFKDLAASADQVDGNFDRATKAALDLAAAGFGTAESNATQLGKALQDPIKGLTALTRSGVTFTAEERNKIKALVESGKLLEAQDLVLQAIETQVGGTAEATANASAKIGVAFEQMKERLGTLLLPAFETFSKFLIDNVVPAIEQHLVPLVERIGTVISEVAPKVVEFAQQFLENVGPSIERVGEILRDTVVPALTTFGEFLRDTVVPAVQELWGWLSDNLVPTLATLARFFADHVLPAAQGLLNFILTKMVPGLKSIFGPVLEGLRTAIEKISGALGENTGTFSNFYTTIEPIINFLRDVAAPIFGTVLKFAIEVLGTAVSNAIKTFARLFEIITKVIDAVKKFARAVAESPVGTALKNIIDTVAGRRYGGIVSAKRPYLVGEAGPELFIPSGTGRIEPDILSGFDLSRVERPVMETRSGITINVSGAIDPEGTARTILRVLEDAQRRTGARL